MYRLENVSKCFLDGGKLRYVYKNIDLHIHQGDMISIIGESGVGKSTFLSMLGLLDFPSSGKMLINEVDVSKLHRQEISEIQRSKLGFILQNNYLIDFLNVIDNIMYPLMLKGINKNEAKKRAEEAMQKVGLPTYANYNVENLSGGEKQRIAIARAIAGKPEIILADEPTGNLDEKNAQQILELLKGLNDEKITIVVVTHNNKLAGSFKRRLVLANKSIAEY